MDPVTNQILSDFKRVNPQIITAIKISIQASVSGIIGAFFRAISNFANTLITKLKANFDSVTANLSKAAFNNIKVQVTAVLNQILNSVQNCCMSPLSDCINATLVLGRAYLLPDSIVALLASNLAKFGSKLTSIINPPVSNFKDVITSGVLDSLEPLSGNAPGPIPIPIPFPSPIVNTLLGLVSDSVQSFISSLQSIVTQTVNAELALILQPLI